MKFENSRIVFFLFFFIIFFHPCKIFSQEPSVNDSFYSKALHNSMAVYHQSFASQAALYNGRLYNDYPFKFKEGQPYFYAEEMTIGSVMYDGILFDSIVMQYDEIADVLIVKNQAGKIQLSNKKITGFHIYNAAFIKLERDSAISNKDDYRFYNLLYKGKITLLKKQIKVIREVISSNTELLRFADEKNHYYIIKDGQWNEVNSSKNFYKILGDHKDEIKQFVKANKLSFRKDRQNMLTKATAYYDSLK